VTTEFRGLTIFAELTSWESRTRGGGILKVIEQQIRAESRVL
jgi:hypothetical protein